MASQSGRARVAFRMRYPANVQEAGQTGKPTSEELRSIGLCFDCQHSQRIQSARGSTFYRCKLSDTDPHFPKYPRLPVIRCAGYAQKPSIHGHSGD
jgi:hypothetical protein